jgi:acyl-CoA dehydrogenase
VQAHLVTVAQQAALAGVAAEAAIEGGGRPVAVAVAKVLCGRAAVTAARAAHQVHGAVGLTRAHPLARETRRLSAWRAEYGGEREWAAGIGRAAVRGGADGLYGVVTGQA